MDPSIILQGRSPNVLANYARGRQLGRQTAMEDMLRQNAGGLMQGDPQALNALAAYDPQLAQGMALQRAQEVRAVQAHDLDMRAKSEGLRIKLAEEKRAILDQAASMNKAQREEAAAKLEAAVRMGLSAQSPEQWDAIMQQRAPEYVGMFGAREMLANEFISTADALKNMQGPEPKTQIVDGQLVTIGRNGATAAPIQGFTPKDRNGFSVTTPDGTTIQYGGSSVQGGMAPGQNPFSTNMPRDTKKLGQKLSENDAATLQELNDAASTATELESLGNQLAIVSQNVGYTGPGGNLYGKTDDLIGVLPGDEGSRGAFRSLAMEAQLKFTEKTKGAITDREMTWFREAVPNLSQRKDANKAISEVMQAGARRVQTRAQFFENWGRKNGSLEGAQEVWSDYMRDNPILEKDGDGIAVRQEGEWKSYLERKPASAYTPDAIMSLSVNEMEAAPIESMTAAQIAAFNARAQQLGFSDGQ